MSTMETLSRPEAAAAELCYTPETVELASEIVYQEVSGRLDEIYTSGRYDLMQKEYGVRPASLVHVETTGHLVHLRADLTDHEHNSSYKIYGAMNAMLAAKAQNPGLKRVYVASAGNHGEAAAVGGLFGLEVHVLMAKDASPAKIEPIQQLGAYVDNSYDSLSEAVEAAKEAGEAKDTAFIHPYNDYDVLAGQSLIGVQLVEDLLASGITGRVVVPAPLGGGGFLSGLIMGGRFARDCAQANGVELPFELEFHGVQMEQGDPARRAIENFQNGLPYEALDDLFPDNDANKKNDGTFAIPGDRTLAVLVGSGLVEDITLVSEAQVGEAMRNTTQWFHLRGNPKCVEPAGALSAAYVEAQAAWLAGEESVTILSLVTGANVTKELYDEFIDKAAAAHNEYLARLGGTTIVVEQAVEEEHSSSQSTVVWSAPVLRGLVSVVS